MSKEETVLSYLVCDVVCFWSGVDDRGCVFAAGECGVWPRQEEGSTITWVRFPVRSGAPCAAAPSRTSATLPENCALDLDCDDDDMNLGCFILCWPGAETGEPFHTHTHTHTNADTHTQTQTHTQQTHTHTHTHTHTPPHTPHTHTHTRDTPHKHTHTHTTQLHHALRDTHHMPHSHTHTTTHTHPHTHNTTHTHETPQTHTHTHTHTQHFRDTHSTHTHIHTERDAGQSSADVSHICWDCACVLVQMELPGRRADAGAGEQSGPWRGGHH